MVTSYDIAHQAAQDALTDIRSDTLRGIVAEAVAAGVVGNGTHGADRWETLSADTRQTQAVVSAALRDLPSSAVVSSGPVAAAVHAAAQALLTEEVA